MQGWRAGVTLTVLSQAAPRAGRGGAKATLTVQWVVEALLRPVAARVLDERTLAYWPFMSEAMEPDARADTRALRAAATSLW